ncbi:MULTISPECIES: DUF1120 domain-containing protein [Paraburkholderia]|uniref:DUF1120 domain-containing protein n=1 Tax=Paraburkholderia TaxID=1822464 RepID=UPI00224E3D72|nr:MULTISPECIES: DUF1120 domain-containing protein [Paraburkholderia]MCX4163081.1 DUF1120 domain-containing protein [Paraburkholderia megapolitana]MDN7158577.1 DUF1120 domain-containing protein [Paraburkholderia sp. CHISQ3]MDQ6495624.1 DUF1120 domain-containing protein [Paraburkholderia megapolitana]
MKQIFPRLAIATVLAAGCMGVHAAETANLTVDGRVKPASCDITLSNGGVVDYGNIIASDLNAANYTVLEERNIKLSINCDAPAKIAMQFSDSKRDSRIFSFSSEGGVKLLRSDNNFRLAGLGLNGDKKIGAYAAILRDVTVDGVVVEHLGRPSGRATWERGAGTVNIVGDVPTDIAWTSRGQSTPIAGKVFAGELSVQAVVNKSGDIGPLTNEITLDGKATLTLVYL